MNYWLLKSEPKTFSIDDLALRAAQIEPWDGVRNYQARNYLRAMQINDQAFFYHSNCGVPGIVGIVSVVREAYPDPTAFDPNHHHYDPKSTPERPTWVMVDVLLQRKLARTITLTEMKQRAPLADLPLVKKGARLSVMPVNAAQWAFILGLEQQCASSVA